MSLQCKINVLYLDMKDKIRPDPIESNNDYLMSEPAVVYEARSGVEPSIFTDLLLMGNYTKDELAAYFNTSSKTIHRYMASGKMLDAFTAEHALSMKNVFLLGIDVFENLENFRVWLQKPNYTLGNMIPQELMKTPGGLRLLKEALLRIEFGATA